MKNLLKDKEIPSSADYAVVAYDSKEGKVSFKGGSEPTPPQPTFEYVDLGLPSGLKWAKCNVGATSEEEVGKYFQWGDTIGYYEGNGAEEHSTWATAPFNNGTSDYYSTAFASVSGTVCPDGVLANEYDAASVNMGGNWRMPTEADCKELTANTNSSWEENFNGSGVNGAKFTSKKDSTKYIFIPAAGGAINGSMGNVGSSGLVWSSNLGSSGPYNALRLLFNSGNLSVGNGSRTLGLSVRGVLK